MVTEVDEGKGLVKVYWADIRKRVAKVEPTFAKIVNELSPDKTFPIYLAYYPYGAFKGDTETIFIPKSEGGHYSLLDLDAPKDVLKHLGYGKHDSPLGMVLEKCFEIFTDLKIEGITIPSLVYSPGDFISFMKNLSRKSNRTYSSNSIFAATSGVRSTFMLPNIGCTTNHLNLQRDLNIKSPPAKSLYEHWYVFKELTNGNQINCDWRSCLMYFSKKWLEKIHSDKAWLTLKLYLHEKAWQRFQYNLNHFHYDVVFSIIQKRRNLKPNPYLTDTARHLFAAALGAAPSYVPAHNNDALPLDILQKIFVELYGLKKYYPTIMQPIHFKFEHEKAPVYYSLQNPSTGAFSPRSRTVSSTLFEMRELAHIMEIFIDELSKDNSMCSDSIISQIAKNIQFNYFHNKTDRHHVIRPSNEIETLDERFNFVNPKYKVKDAKFASDAPFVRGCISIKTKS